jgi:RNA polymerase sigma-70 factor (ECF subfamily)
MRAARRGDAAAYERLLAALAAAIRPTVRRRLARMGLGTSETEDVVQEVLLAIHAKRHTWDEARPILPWVGAVARYKVVDAVRRLGRDRRRRVEAPVEDWADLIPDVGPDPDRTLADAERALAGLSAREAGVVRAVALEGASMREAAGRLHLSEGAVRVALHRGLRRLAALAGAPSGPRTAR